MQTDASPDRILPQEDPMSSHPQPANETPDPRDVQERLARSGVGVTPSTAAGRSAVLSREPLSIPGVSLSETVVRMREEQRAGA